ncbi:complexin-3-like [Bombina bombina]|uniref:complexin-3-like n=1 Tax=Bombina bombina TaxID=8345 RepID=UPI00235B2C2D|nr:complexin-3-like [Bombina bombina]
MGSIIKSIFGGPVKSMSCCTSGGFAQEQKPIKEEKPGWNILRRWSSEEQHRKDIQEEMKRRDSLFAQRKAERAVMREHFREKYHLTQNSRDEQQVKGAGGNRKMSKDLRIMVKQDEPSSDDFSILGMLGYHSLDLDYLKKSAHSTMDSIQPAARCLLM